MLLLRSFGGRNEKWRGNIEREGDTRKVGREGREFAVGEALLLLF